MTLIDQIASGDKPLYDIEFSLACFNADSRLWVLFQFIPEMRDFRYRKEGIDDEQFRELDCMLSSVGVEMRGLAKVPHIEIIEEDAAPLQGDDLEGLTDDEMFVRLLDDVLTAREDIHELFADEELGEQEKNRRIGDKAKSFKHASRAFKAYLGVKTDGTERQDREVDRPS